jgi:hypothetical protein
VTTADIDRWVTKVLSAGLPYPRGRRLSSIAAWINANHALGIKASVEQSFVSTDRKAGRLRIPGKGRKGTRLRIRKDGVELHSHNSAETYRCNYEAELWLARYILGLPVRVRRQLACP